MNSSFVLLRDDENEKLRVDSASICFGGNPNLWSIGIEIIAIANGEDPAILHLADLIIDGETDPRRRERIVIELPYGIDESGEQLTNLYFFEHNETDSNVIQIESADDGKFRVRWSGIGETLGTSSRPM